MEALSDQIILIGWFVGAGILYYLYTLVRWDNNVAKALIWAVAIAWVVYGGSGTMNETLRPLFGCHEDYETGNISCGE